VPGAEARRHLLHDRPQLVFSDTQFQKPAPFGAGFFRFGDGMMRRLLNDNLSSTIYG
jgi:hypothetical protein